MVAAEAEQDALLAKAEEAGDLDEVNRLEVRYWLDGVAQTDGRVQGPAAPLMLEMNGRALAAEPVGDAAERPPAWPRLAQIHVPVLVVAGEHDLPGVAVLCAQLAAALLERAVGRRIAGTAHCPSLDQPDALRPRRARVRRASIG